MRYNSTTQLVSWFIQRDLDGTLELHPPFQRRPVWTPKQKSHFIDSVLRELPIPEIYLQTATSPEGLSRYVVVDGQQRIRTILEFAGVASRTAFEIADLDFESPWLGYTFDQLTEDEKRRFYSYRLGVRDLYEVTEAEIKELFIRYNKFLVPLNAQELRHATYSGSFIRLAEDLADDPFWTDNRTVTPSDTRRMKDVQFVSDLLIGLMHGPQSGNDASLNEYYQRYEEEPDAAVFAPHRRTFDRIRALIEDVFPDLRQHRWRNKTDFYSVFVALGVLVREHGWRALDANCVRSVLDDFETAVRSYQEDENAPVSSEVRDYVEAMRRGANDATRRGARHNSLVSVLSACMRAQTN